MLSRCQASKSATTSLLDSLSVHTRPLQAHRRSVTSILASATQTRCYTNTKRFAESDALPGPSRSGGWAPYKKAMNELIDELDKIPKGKRPSLNTTTTNVPKSRQTMTERESKVLTGMLDMIFTSKSEEAKDDNLALPESVREEEEVGVGAGQVDDLFNRLRRYSTRTKRPRVNTQIMEMLDKKKEAMSYCTDDQQLLEWAAREVFDESVRYEEVAKQAIQQERAGLRTGKTPPLQSPIYPQMIAHLMRTFRDQYRDPNLALFIFNHAQSLSIISYVFGCSTEAYNELIETRWSSFGHLKGVHAAIEEMEVNAVPVNRTTHKLVEEIRRELGRRELNTSESEEWQMMASMEEIVSRIASSKKKPTTGVSWDSWKREVLNDDDSGFDDWSSLDATKFERGGRDPFGRPAKRGVQAFR